MLKFNEFLSEAHDTVINIDTNQLNGNVKHINAELDVLTSKPYQNAPILLAQLRGCLERYGIMIPASATNHFMDLGAELVYLLGETDKHLYVVFDTCDDGFVEAYAQVVDAQELSDVLAVDQETLLNKDRPTPYQRPSTWYAKRDDDSGNDAEYA